MPILNTYVQLATPTEMAVLSPKSSIGHVNVFNVNESDKRTIEKISFYCQSPLCNEV